MGKKTPRQMDFAFLRRGGKRRGAGRKPKGERAGALHVKRPELKARYPVLVTMRLCAGLASLRLKDSFEITREAMRSSLRECFQVVEFSIQSNHLHLIVEARDERSLSRGMIGLTVRLARGLNRLWRRIGSVFADRFHSRILTTPTSVRTALVYVLGNARKHGAWRAKRPDDYSSAPTFDGWLVTPRNPAESNSGPIARARTWLLAKGWKRLGLLHPLDAPAVLGPPRRRITRRIHPACA